MTEMYVPKRGDRVRVVLEGEVGTSDRVNDEFFIKGPSGRGNWVYEKAGNIVSVEKIGPKWPTAHGSVARIITGCGTGYTVVRDDPRGLWRHADGSATYDLDAFKRVDVIFDAGVTSNRNNQEEK